MRVFLVGHFPRPGRPTQKLNGGNLNASKHIYFPPPIDVRHVANPGEVRAALTEFGAEDMYSDHLVGALRAGCTCMLPGPNGEDLVLKPKRDAE